jgi:hypothetical protein
MAKVAIRTLIGLKAICGQDGCGQAGVVSPGRNLPSAFGNTFPPPPPVPVHFPPGALRYEYPPSGPVYNVTTCIHLCPRHGSVAYYADDLIEPAPGPEEVSP